MATMHQQAVDLVIDNSSHNKDNTSTKVAVNYCVLLLNCTVLTKSIFIGSEMHCHSATVTVTSTTRWSNHKSYNKSNNKYNVQ